LFIAAPWRPRDAQLCAPLAENMDAVRSGAERRASDTWEAHIGGRLSNNLHVERGDFASNLTLDQLRACLGEGWNEIHARAQATDTGDAWVFVRAGWPRVLYVQSHTVGYRNATWRIVIERADPAR
jgi:hypothetical protein